MAAINEWAAALGIEPRLLYALIALLFIAFVYYLNPTVGWIFGGLAILAILTQ